MASFSISKFLLCFFLFATVSGLRFRLTLRDGKTIEGDIDLLDQIHVAGVRTAFSNQRIQAWAAQHLQEIKPYHRELLNLSYTKLTSPSESLDYLEDLVQENDPEIQAFVIELFRQAGMRLELFPCTD